MNPPSSCRSLSLEGLSFPGTQTGAVLTHSNVGACVSAGTYKWCTPLSSFSQSGFLKAACMEFRETSSNVLLIQGIKVPFNSHLFYLQPQLQFKAQPEAISHILSLNTTCMTLLFLKPETLPPSACKIHH